MTPESTDVLSLFGSLLPTVLLVIVGLLLLVSLCDRWAATSPWPPADSPTGRGPGHADGRRRGSPAVSTPRADGPVPPPGGAEGTDPAREARRSGAEAPSATHR